MECVVSEANKEYGVSVVFMQDESLAHTNYLGGRRLRPRHVGGQGKPEKILLEFRASNHAFGFVLLPFIHPHKSKETTVHLPFNRPHKTKETTVQLGGAARHQCQGSYF